MQIHPSIARLLLCATIKKGPTSMVALFHILMASPVASCNSLEEEDVRRASSDLPYSSTQRRYHLSPAFKYTYQIPDREGDVESFYYDICT
jgi:hypothetical protein